MSTSSKHFRREQRLALRVAIGIVVLVLVLVIPLVLSGALRLRLAHEFGFAPGEGVPQIAGANQNIDLLVAPVMQADTRTDRPVRTLVALYIARTEPGGVVLQDVNTDRQVLLPLASFDHVAAAPDASRVLFVEGDTSNAAKAVLVTVASGEVEPLPAGQRRPALPGEWDASLWDNVSVRCDAVSPQLAYVACLDPPEAAHYLAGDWEIRMQVYGDFRAQIPVYRGRGFLPIAGWTRDEQALYFQNEDGLWRADVPAELSRELGVGSRE